MQTTLLNYRIIVEPDSQTGTGKLGYTAYAPTLGVADDGKTIEEAIKNVRGAIEAFVESLIVDGQPVPTDRVEQDLVATAQISVNGPVQFAF
ncbi:MAG: hypothetical protein UY21_C0006G0013 [Microgenomates group bacterium GW2011_GWA1_48_10]|uniref:Uncharacterized protein n=1 Tax=Candidatus Gottesmanbacteria bacterium RIFCSPHIGHO2_01_FULL_47_48 TaxID=1798381 RepID=A0A1F6A3Y6_9BACT|nr:MAG: hypothetical protein UY21_C0006G0013 [Microgenomates group bacterium GW2011_GWA1_48_10]OGG19399.1 MAG: hypothetical protein A2721_02635 [Candidatus Gottesmanbacteria bacterium RIFCSPHIGHO2_01_FULL_47_48]